MTRHRSAPSTRRFALAATFIAALAGCARADYLRPDLPLPERYHHEIAARPVEPGAWWTELGDPVLARFVDTALDRNQDLAAAALLVRRAQLQAGLVDARRLPQLAGGVDLSRSRDEDGETGRSARASFSVGYELDLWGRLAATSDVAEWEARATRADFESTRLALIGTAVNLWAQLAFAHERAAVEEQSLAVARRTRELVEVQYDAGAVSGLQRHEAEQTLSAQQAALSQVLQQRAETRNAIVLLLGGERWDETAEPRSLERIELPAVAEGLPATLLATRPDVRAAEDRLRGALAGTDVARLSFLPTLSLTGSAGSASTSLSNLLANPVVTLGAGLALPFLDWRERTLELRVSQADYARAVALFRQALLQALTDVENALVGRVALQARRDALERAVAAAAEAERLEEVRYRAGATPLRTWLDAQERRRAATIALSQNRLEQVANHVSLNLALGRGVPASGARPPGV
jgi:NodT family efflux transporter outer membrane factor (OMF) lipoprotein